MDYLGGLEGPCVACPAHTFVFDAGSGRCLTNPRTPAARTYPAWAEATPDGGARIFCRPEAKPPAAPSLVPVTREAANQIQMALVEKGLRLRYGDGTE